MDFGFGWIDLRVGRAWAGKRSQGCEVVEDSGKAESAGPAKRRLPPREKLLDAAEALFYANGIHSVGIDRILAETSVAKATLYRHFPSKDDLVAAYLTRRHERVIAGMAEAYYSPIAPHNPQGPVSLAASYQVAASIPNFLMLSRSRWTSASLLKGFVRDVPRIVPPFGRIPVTE